jgi:hypothetical protein
VNNLISQILRIKYLPIQQNIFAPQGITPSLNRLVGCTTLNRLLALAYRVFRERIQRGMVGFISRIQLSPFLNTTNCRQFKSQDHQKGQEDRPTSSCLGHHLDPPFGGVVQRAFWDELVAEHLIDFGSILQFSSSVSARVIVVEERRSHRHKHE